PPFRAGSAPAPLPPQQAKSGQSQLKLRSRDGLLDGEPHKCDLSGGVDGAAHLNFVPSGGRRVNVHYFVSQGPPTLLVRRALDADPLSEILRPGIQIEGEVVQARRGPDDEL